MSEENKLPTDGQVDLTALSNLQFETAWSKTSAMPRNNFEKNKGKKPFNKKFSKEKSGEFKKGKPFNKKFDRKNAKFKKPMPFKFSLDVLFYPDDAPFTKLTSLMKSSKRTYQLFDIAEVILSKMDRLVVLVKNLPDAEGNVKPLYSAQPLNLPFEDEQSAKKAALDFFVDEMFIKEQIEAQAPNGTFLSVNKCGITGKLLGAPNWHKYSEFLKEHYTSNCPNVPYEKFTSSIESVKDEALITQWLEEMKVRNVYKLKEPKEDEESVFETREAACAYVLRTCADNLVKTYDQVRFKGAHVSLLPYGNIRRNIEEALKAQKKFPIITANNMRGRLRRTAFAVYKRGSKGFTFVCAVKRKFLYEGDTLSDSAQKIFDFILANPALTVEAMPYKFFNMDFVPTTKAKTLVQEHNQAVSENTSDVETSDDNQNQLTPEDKIKLNSIWTELSWLISEGYVVEYADTTLQANPYLPRPKDKAQKDLQDAENLTNLGIADEPVLTKKTQEAEAETEAKVEEEVKAETEVAPQSEIETPKEEVQDKENA